jgi:cobalt/nickel transport protein
VPALLILATLSTPAEAHFTMLLPSAASVKKGETVTLICQWGHPFEHQLFDTPAPVSLTVRDPDGKKTDLTSLLEKVEVSSGDKKVAAYQARFTPQARGDFVFVLQMPPIWMEEDGEFLEDTAQAVLHVQVQKGWEAPGSASEWEPLTRPYGQEPGVAFQARLRSLPAELVEIERSNPTPPRDLPPDEHITRTARTDPNGVVTATLTESGWWCLAACTAKGNRERDRKMVPLRKRAILWVFVDDRPKAR